MGVIYLPEPSTSHWTELAEHLRRLIATRGLAHTVVTDVGRESESVASRHDLDGHTNAALLATGDGGHATDKTTSDAGDDKCTSKNGSASATADSRFGCDWLVVRGLQSPPTQPPLAHTPATPSHEDTCTNINLWLQRAVDIELSWATGTTQAFA